MIGLDANVLVRYLLQDDPDRSRRATRFITDACSTDEPGLINRIVLCEIVWVLETAYGYPRETVAMALERILRTAQFSSRTRPRHGPHFASIRTARTSRAPSLEP